MGRNLNEPHLAWKPLKSNLKERRAAFGRNQKIFATKYEKLHRKVLCALGVLYDYWFDSS